MRLNTQSCNYDFLWIDTDEWVWGWTDKKLTPASICSHSHAKRLLLRLYSISACIWQWFCSEGRRRLWLSRWRSLLSSWLKETDNLKFWRKCMKSFFFFCFFLSVSVDPFTSLTSDTWPHWPAQFYIRTTNHNNSTYVSAFNLKIVAISSAYLCRRNTLGGRRSKVTSAAGRNEECRMEDKEHQHTILTLLHHIYKLLWLFST